MKDLKLLGTLEYIAQQYRENASEEIKDRGYVLITYCNNEYIAYGWKDELRNPEEEKPNNYAVDINADIYISEGGDDLNGALKWSEYHINKFYNKYLNKEDIAIELGVWSNTEQGVLGGVIINTLHFDNNEIGYEIYIKSYTSFDDKLYQIEHGLFETYGQALSYIGDILDKDERSIRG